MSKHSNSVNKINRTEPKDYFDNDFLTSKDLALQPIHFFSNIDCNLEEISTKTRHLSLKGKKELKKDKNSCSSNKSKKSKSSQKSQKSTSNTNQKQEKKRSNKETQIYNSNIVIVQLEDENENASYRDPIEEEIKKLKKFMSKSRDTKEKEEKKKFSKF